ncbi:MAG: NnrS family protein [Myxococcales bacterium]|nr:NnrS family protein [Myxococcales bacterium]
MAQLIQLTEPRPQVDARGFALFDKGFRVFFALASLHAALFVPAWVLMVTGFLPMTASGMSWHGHEMLFGFAVAVIAGFLLTAASNWTGRETARGVFLGSLAGVWLLGRAAPFVLPGGLAAAVDLAFLPLVMLALGRAIVPTRNRRNYGFLGLLALLELLSALHHAGGLGWLPGWERKAQLLAVDVIAIIICVMTARVLPMFTRNATGFDVKRRPLAERAALVGLGAVLALGVADAPAWAVSSVAGLTALALVVRSWGWGFRASLGTPLLWVLHLGNAFLALSLALRAVPSLASSQIALHAFTLGCLAMLCLGMMARVSLGHTGRALAPSGAVEVSFWLLLVSVGARVVAPWLLPAFYRGQLLVAGVAWSLAFGVFLVASLPMWLRARVDGKPG